MVALSLNGSSGNANIQNNLPSYGVYNGGAGLTSVGSVKGSTINESNGTVTSNIGGSKVSTSVIKMDNQGNSDTYAQTPMVCLFGSKVNANGDAA